jgi:hypothetical protein
MAEVQQQLLLDSRKKKDGDHLLNLQPSNQLDLFSAEDGMFLFHVNNARIAQFTLPMLQRQALNPNIMALANSKILTDSQEDSDGEWLFTPNLQAKVMFPNSIY